MTHAPPLTPTAPKPEGTEGGGCGCTMPACTHPPLDPHQCILAFDLITRRQNGLTLQTQETSCFWSPKKSPKKPKKPKKAQKSPKKPKQAQRQTLTVNFWEKVAQNAIQTDRPPNQPVNLPQTPLKLQKKTRATPPQLAWSHLPEKQRLCTVSSDDKSPFQSLF